MIPVVDLFAGAAPCDSAGCQAWPWFASGGLAIA